MVILSWLIDLCTEWGHLELSNSESLEFGMPAPRLPAKVHAGIPPSVHAATCTLHWIPVLRCQNFQTGQPVELEDQCRESSGKDRNFPYDYDIPWLNRDVIQPRLLQIPTVLFPPFTIWHIGTSSSFVRATPRQCQGQWEELACNLGTSDVENKPISCKSMLRGLI